MHTRTAPLNVCTLSPQRHHKQTHSISRSCREFHSLINHRYQNHRALQCGFHHCRNSRWIHHTDQHYVHYPKSHCKLFCIGNQRLNSSYTYITYANTTYSLTNYRFALHHSPFADYLHPTTHTHTQTHRHTYFLQVEGKLDKHKHGHTYTVCIHWNPPSQRVCNVAHIMFFSVEHDFMMCKTNTLQFGQYLQLYILYMNSNLYDAITYYIIHYGSTFHKHTQTHIHIFLNIYHVCINIYLYTKDLFIYISR